MNKDMPIVCINLERATERRAMIEKEWISDRSCPVHFIEAYDRRKIDAGELLFDYDSTAAVKFFNRPLTPGEIACATSHALAVRYAKESNMESVVIIEDDMIPTFESYEQFNDILSHMQIEFPQSCAAMLHKEHLYLPYILAEKKQHFGIVSRASYGACMYYLHCSAYDSFLEDLLSYRAPADWHWKRYIDAKQLVAPIIPLAYHSGKETYIGNEYRGKASYREYIE